MPDAPSDAKPDDRELVRDLRRLFSLSLDMICVAGMDGYFKLINPAFGEILGYTDEQVTARPFLDFIHPEDVPATLAEVEKLARGAKTIWFENRYRCADGSYKWIAWKASPVPEDQLMYCVGRDMSKVKQHERDLAAARDAALEASRLKSQFLANVSHELRTPLNSIIGFSEVLIDGIAGKVNDEQLECLRDIHDSGNHLLRLINNILDLSRIEAGRMEVQLEAVDLGKLMRSTMDKMKPLAKKKGQRLTLEDPAGLGAAWADADHVRQVIFNLLSNAIKFSGTGGHIRMRARRLESLRYLEVEVEDDGVGITPEQLEAVFDEFSQADDGHEDRHEGSGLGLALCRQLLGLMGGEIRATSERGRGSVFSFTLPAAR